MRLQKFADNIWVADGSPVNSIGPWKHTTRMIVIRLFDGSLWINSPIAGSDDEIRALQQLGVVRYLVAPIRFHVWRLKKWMQIFPNAETWGPPTIHNAIEGVTFDGILGDAPPPAWSQELGQMIFRCSPAGDEAEFLHRPSRTLIVSDCIQEPRSPVSYVTRPIVQLSRTRRTAGRISRAEMLSWDFDGLILAHGPCIQKGARAYVERALGWL